MYIHHSWEKRNRSSLIANRTLTDSQDNKKTQQCYQPQPGGVPRVHCNAYHTYSSTDSTYIHLDPTGILATLHNQEFMPPPVLAATMTLPKKYQYRKKNEKKVNDNGHDTSKKRTRDIYLPKTVRKKLKLFERIINEHCFGKKFRENNLRLKFVAVIEGQYTNPHIHLIVEVHSNLSPSILKHLWKDRVSPRSSIRATAVEKVTEVDDLAGLAEYLVKAVRWGEVETEPYFFGPKKTDDNQTGSSHE
jgi:hypothetical protein